MGKVTLRAGPAKTIEIDSVSMKMHRNRERSCMAARTGPKPETG